MAQPLLSIKVLIVGDENVGKTNFVMHQTEKQISGCHVPTLGVSYHKSSVTVAGETTLMEISDSSGKECYRSHLPTFLGDADVVILMFDVTNRKSFDNLRILNDDLRSYCFRDVSTYVIGNKKNLAGRRNISKKEAQRFSSAIGATYFDCSSHILSNVEGIFQGIVLDVRTKWNSISDITMVPLYTPPNQDEKYTIIKEVPQHNESAMRYDQMWGSYLAQIADRRLNGIVTQLQSE